MLGLNQDDHLHRMCNETGIPDFLEFTIPGIPMVVMVTSRVRSLRAPTQQDFINLHPTHIYMSHAFQILKNPPEYTMRYSVQPGRSTKMKHMLIFWEMRDSSISFTPILPKSSHHTIHKVSF